MTAEHSYQWKKFEKTEPELAHKIVQAGSPLLAKKISRQSANLHPDWKQIRLKVMEEIALAKFKQHDDALVVLLATGNKKIVENSPWDSFWGEGPDGKGENQMGLILMKVRTQLSTSS